MSENQSPTLIITSESYGEPGSLATGGEIGDRLEEPSAEPAQAADIPQATAANRTDEATDTVRLEAAGPDAGGDVPAVREDTSVYIAGTDGLTGKTVNVPLEKVISLHRTIYVENAHAPQPNILDVQFRVHGHFRETILRIDEATFDRLVATRKFKVRYSYVDDFLQNDPNAGQLLQRTYQVDYPEWIRMEDLLKQDRDHARYYAPKLSTTLEKKLFPNFKEEKVKADNALAEQERASRKSRRSDDESEIQDEFSNPRPTLTEAMAD